jgi:hypothetical protein
MLRRTREPFGKAGLIVAVIALIAGLAGGAYAAGALTGKQKKEVKNIAKRFAGKDGAQGPAGQAGLQGAKGDAGANGPTGANGAAGANGSNGKDGKDGKAGEGVTIIPLSSGDANCPNGGTKFTNQAGSSYACNGTGGTGGLPGTMTGYWEILGDAAVQFPGVEWAVTTISFPFPPETVPTETLLIDNDATEPEKDKCPGSSENPQAAVSGVLCLYLGFSPAPVALQNSSVTKSGAGLFFAKTDEGFGAWAVKAVDAP